MRWVKRAVRDVRGCAAIVPAAVLLLAAAPGTAHADVLLLDGGRRVEGDLVEETTDVHRTRWLRVRTPFGHVNVRKADVRKHLRSERATGALAATEIVVTTIRGSVEKSSDGQAWERLSPRANTAETWATLPVNAPNAFVAPGDRVRTGEDGEIDLDLGFATVHVAAGSEVAFPRPGAATLRVERGEAAARVDEVPRRRDFTVETPQASMGVRGTRFRVAVDPDGADRFAVEEGTIDVNGLAVRAGGAVEARAGSEPAPVEQDAGDATAFERLRRAVAIPRLEWVEVPGGVFEMGLNPDETAAQRPAEAPRHTVSVPAFRMSRFELTNGQFRTWFAWMRDHGDHFFCHPGEPEGFEHTAWVHTDLPWRDHAELVPTDDDLPVHGLDWLTAYSFCAWLGARLPSEAEWEYAARAGDTTGFPYGASQDATARHEWIGLNSGERELDPLRERTALQARHGNAEGNRLLYLAQVENRNRPRPPGTRRPNAFGLHDMLGNVMEWCADRHHASYDGAPDDGSAWVARENLSEFGLAQRVRRGGHYLSEWGNPLRASWRSPLPGPIGVRPVAVPTR